MIYRLAIEFTLDKKQRLDYNIGSVLQGIMMTYLDRDYGDVLHKQSLRPYSQYFEIKEGKYYWIINTLTDEAKSGIIDKILMSDRTSLDFTYRKTKLNIEKFELSKGIILDNEGKRDIVLNFKTPTSFKKTSGGYEIFPSVKHIFNSLINKYEKFGNIYLDEDLMKKIENKESLLKNIIENVEITGYNLKTEHFGVKGNYVPGFMGSINLKLKGNTNLKNDVMKLLQFGKYSGVGLKSTMGMGAIEMY
ncbi:CRISPR-associated endoribonuclease Cas6 [Intestinibacter sp.]